MKIIATDRLTFSYLQKLGRYNYFATAAAVLIVTFSLFWMLFGIGGTQGTTALGNTAYVLSALLASFCCFLTAFRASRGAVRPGQRFQRVWLLIGLGLFLNCLGGLYYQYLQFINASSFPSPADIFFNLSYPFIFAGLLLMPTTVRFNARMILDTLIVAFCLLGVSWFFVLGPIYFLETARPVSFTQVVELIAAFSYPCWNIVLLLALLVVIQRHIEPPLRFTLLLIGISIVSYTWADIAYAYLNVFLGTYQTGTPYVDTFWFIGDLMLGLSALQQYSAIARRAYKEQTHLPHLSTHPERAIRRLDRLSFRRWRSFQTILVYVPLIILLALTIYAEFAHNNMVADYLSLITALTAVLVATRYVITTRENDRLLREREQKQIEAESLRYIVTQLTDIFEMDRLREQAVRLAISELGFEAAMLIFVQDHNHPLNILPHISVTAISTSTGATTWQIQGDNILYRTFLLGKRATLHWPSHLNETPQEVLKWQQEQHIPSMIFFPLIYQGRLLGSLGVARKRESEREPEAELSYQSASMLRAYAEQVATLIDHARLYQEAREHETFARAMANIATRLNEAVIEPAEIGQLICEEGARALSAEYALLYISTNEGHLLPFSSYVSEQEQIPPPGEWPGIYFYEYEAQALHSLQPTLIYVAQPTTPSPRLSVLIGKNEALRRPSGTLSPIPALPTAPTTSALTPIAHTSTSPNPTRSLSSSLRKALSQRFVRTAILTPLIARGEPVGVLIFARSHAPGARERRSFDASDLPLAQDFGEQAGVAFTNARLYQHLHNAHERLKELDQMKDQFMVTASHELRTPLTAIQGYIELMAEYGDALPPDQRREFLEKARRGCDELAVLLGNVMDASRLEGETGVRPALMKRVSLQEMVDSVVILIEPHLTKEQRELHLQIPSNLYVYADPVRLRQVLMNVSTNALKYSPQQTPIGFSAGATSASVILSISDKGKGVKPAEQHRIFDRFYRVESDLNSPVRGSGLGLYIAQRLINAMGGKIWIESKGIPGEGSTFHIQLPMAN